MGVDVRVRLVCTSVYGGFEGAMHDVVLQADGSLRTPHDLEAERIGVALGGYLSCLEVADRAVPAVLDWLALQRRVELPHLRRDKQSRWHLRERLDCCGQGWLRAADAAEHARSVPHLARRFGTQPRLLRPFTAALSTAFGWPDGGAPLDALRAATAEGRVAGRGGATLLWACGIAPEVVVDVHDALAGCRSRLPVEFYLGAVTRRPDLAWVAHSGSFADRPEPDPETLTWLAWSETKHDRLHPVDRGDWLRLGVPRSVLLSLSDQRYAPSEVQQFGEVLGRTPAHAAVLLLSWTSAGLQPEVSRLMALHATGVADLRLSAAALRRLVKEAASAGIELADLDAAELLTVWGNVPEALACARAGRSDPLALARTLHRSRPM
ncbi:MAG TPA: hypothetical protein VLR26_09735 [Frankiaceae bacterium]|nr:hypothetical protein [Frankiaceae bacterium]